MGLNLFQVVVDIANMFAICAKFLFDAYSMQNDINPKKNSNAKKLTLWRLKLSTYVHVVHKQINHAHDRPGCAMFCIWKFFKINFENVCRMLVAMLILFMCHISPFQSLSPSLSQCINIKYTYVKIVARTFKMCRCFSYSLYVFVYLCKNWHTINNIWMKFYVHFPCEEELTQKKLKNTVVTTFESRNSYEIVHNTLKKRTPFHTNKIRV